MGRGQLTRNHPGPGRGRPAPTGPTGACARHGPRSTPGMATRAGWLLLLAPLLAGCPQDPPAPAPIPPLPAARPHEEPPQLAGPAAPPEQPADPQAPVQPPPAEPREEGEEPEVWDGQEPLSGPDDPVQPAPPPPAPPEEVDPASVKPVVEGPITRLPGIRIWRDEKRIEVDGLVCIKQGPALELMGCTRRGKTHESLFLFECAPEHLQLALILIGLEPTPQVDDFGQAIALEKGEKVVLEVSWKAEDAPQNDAAAPAPVEGRIRRWVEDVIWDRRRRGSMQRVGWVFTGSRQVKVPAPPDWKTEKEVFAAGYTGNVVAVYHDPDAILDTPLAEGGDDTLFYPYAERLPEAQTPIVIHIRPWSAADQEAHGGPSDPGASPPPPEGPAGEPDPPEDPGGR